VGTIFAKRPLQRRITVLAAAYAIALASLIASFVAARAAAEATINRMALFATAAGRSSQHPFPTKTAAKSASVRAVLAA